MRREKLSNCFFEYFACFKGWRFLCIDVNWRTGSWVVTNAWLAFANFESSKSGKNNFFSSYQSFLDHIKSCVQC